MTGTLIDNLGYVAMQLTGCRGLRQTTSVIAAIVVVPKAIVGLSPSILSSELLVRLLRKTARYEKERN